MGRIDDDQPLEPLGVRDGERPGDDAAPVVADEHEPLAAEMIGEGAEILDHVRDPVLRELRRLVREVVAPHVRRHGLMLTAEVRELRAPLVPELGEPVDEQHQIPLTSA